MSYYGTEYFDDGTSVTIYDCGEERWSMNGKLHRENGPAISYEDGWQEWWLHGKCHREDGPAIVNHKGEKWWYLNDEQVSWQDVFRLAKTQEQQVRILCYVAT